MSSGIRRVVRSAVFLLCVFFSVTAAYNVMADNAEVQRLAEGVACGDGVGCRAQMTRMERTPLAQTFAYATPKRNVDVRCARALVLVGEYHCTLR